MRVDLLGLDRAEAERLLRAEGKTPTVEVTCVPGRAGERAQAMRIVYASDTGERLIAAPFAPPLSVPLGN